MKIQIDLNDEQLKESIMQILARQATTNQAYYHERELLRACIKDIVYSRKDELIDRAVKTASKELVKKGMNKLIDELKGV